ncbi:uncharacterized protein LOC125229305 [Leguminivora glycinivorella]|uniref:uncharacterized protein LOC125229305 n=1 Tax=Leguminivora glycinivorella TaxID=1035111 RepID=UPI002010269B|nr:uncharacterized protein LOC125229305 [Leguminivora glycinivorella]
MPLVFNTYKNLGTSDMRFCDIFQVHDAQTYSGNNTFTDMSPVCDDTIVPFTFIILSGYAIVMTTISILAVIIVKYIGKKFMYIGFHLLCSTLAFTINVVPIDWSIAAFLGMMCNVVCMGVCTSYAVELFPTYMRAMAVGLSMMFARAISFIFFNIIGVQLLNNCGNFLIYLGVFLLAGAALGLLLPSDRKQVAK